MKKIINSRKVELKKLIMMTGIALSAIALTSKVDTVEAYASSGEEVLYEDPEDSFLSEEELHYWDGPMVEESKRDLDVPPEPVPPTPTPTPVPPEPSSSTIVEENDDAHVWEDKNFEVDKKAMPVPTPVPVEPEPMPTPVPVPPEPSSSSIVEENDGAPVWEDKDFEDDKKDISELPSVPNPMTDEELKKHFESETVPVPPDKSEDVANDDYVVIYETTEEPLEETVTPVKENKKTNYFDLYIIILAALGTAYAVYKNISMDKTEDDSFSDYKVNSMDEIEDYSFDPEYEDSYQTEEEQTKRRWL